MAGIEMRQAEALKGHSECRQEHDAALIAHRAWLQDHDRSMAQHHEWMGRIETNLGRIETKLEEATDKLNGLIAFIDDITRRRGKDL